MSHPNRSSAMNARSPHSPSSPSPPPLPSRPSTSSHTSFTSTTSHPSFPSTSTRPSYTSTSQNHLPESRLDALYKTSSFFTSKAKTALALAKTYAQYPAGEGEGKKATWEEWIRDWTTSGETKRSGMGKEEVHLLPGWAVRRYREKKGAEGEGAQPFDLHLWVSGYAILSRDLSEASRTQRAIVSLAKRYAALSRVLTSNPSSSPTTPLTASPQEELDEESGGLSSVTPAPPSTSSTPLPPSSVNNSISPPKTSPLQSHIEDQPARISSTDIAFALPGALQLARENLDRRLSPFWSKSLAYRPLSISVYSSPPPYASHPKFVDPSNTSDFSTSKDENDEPLLQVQSTTDSQGHFAHHLVIPWERLAVHPPSLPMVFDEGEQPWILRVKAVMKPVEVQSNQPGERSRGSSPPSSLGNETNVRPRFVAPAGRIHSAPTSVTSSIRDDPLIGDRNSKKDDVNSLSTRLNQAVLQPASRPGQNMTTYPGVNSTTRPQSTEASIAVAVNRDGGVRILSDLDDTIKHSDILAGPRETFRNVFCRPLEEICVPGTNSMFQAAESAGAAGFHFVSNSPFELLPSITAFLHTHRFPSFYSLKLKFYGGRSILTSLFESPADRKRASILDIFATFSNARFILFGDSGEQDLELYLSIAQERPGQVLAIFIRDITSERADKFRNLPLVPPKTTLPLISSASSLPLVPSRAIPLNISTKTNDTDSFQEGASISQEGMNSRSSSRRGSISTDDTTTEEIQALTAAQQKILKRAALWESRVERAWKEVPDGVELVFWKDVVEIHDKVVALVRLYR
ncbi:hypothetical protein TREMEDRAFT_63151 [Tremella mesenterica DSM 1558]|uniref:uncharacterized protein n=1 Tax=Tremella mesenterica (strain ATCC 24925 / CBS 8224 / DSM 1558 / NBRC 9311 / NRRL Y-6157 / RJB 2259-6 / UBC 559-6) TaxID=578456 RepID=UPI0003F4928F|nr:uncharacterized protein TREMEDRAFT_63151 [Tremella mesenterica DSM 1558]EIW68687.1 hypothetical protein TREMEDRAFT_63151 [Tremella mesenterica DSM 1558]